MTHVLARADYLQTSKASLTRYTHPFEIIHPSLKWWSDYQIACHVINRAGDDHRIAIPASLRHNLWPFVWLLKSYILLVTSWWIEHETNGRCSIYIPGIHVELKILLHSALKFDRYRYILLYMLTRVNTCHVNVNTCHLWGKEHIHVQISNRTNKWRFVRTNSSNKRKSTKQTHWAATDLDSTT